MVNFNGTIISSSQSFLDHGNRGLRYGDSLFETIKVVNGKINFWEPHYLRLMASMRILRMEIPMNFTMEFLSSEISDLLAANELQSSPARVRITVFRNAGGLYTPETGEISYIIESHPLDDPFYTIDQNAYEIELFKDHFTGSGLLSTLKTNNRLVNILAGVYARENGYDSCLLLNEKKEVVEAISGNLFLVKGNTIKTPPLESGALNGIMRKQLIEVIGKTDEFQLEEKPVSPFELQKADEMFITNVITGIIPVSKYRKKEYGSEVSKKLIGRLNALLRLS
ncbi:aminotransferase class IV [Robertkochia aurantiaca]|uniref:aminotransferase class IV n=1 Tax=Robertkochia aurantiaca TaxID=2873700 RepID=UPI001CCFA957|nr:aminotransferase class IV [Robertkochia sp. 3YJGBD-33]